MHADAVTSCNLLHAQHNGQRLCAWETRATPRAGLSQSRPSTKMCRNPNGNVELLQSTQKVCYLAMGRACSTPEGWNSRCLLHAYRTLSSCSWLSLSSLTMADCRTAGTWLPAAGQCYSHSKLALIAVLSTCCSYKHLMAVRPLFGHEETRQHLRDAASAMSPGCGTPRSMVLQEQLPSFLSA